MQPLCNRMIFRRHVLSLESIERQRSLIWIEQIEEIVNAALQNLNARELKRVKHGVVPLEHLLQLIVVRDPYNLGWLNLFLFRTFFSRWVINSCIIWLCFLQRMEAQHAFIDFWKRIYRTFLIALWLFVSLDESRTGWLFLWFWVLNFLWLY